VSWGWELFWMMVILKIPVIYLACVIWWAVRGKPRPLEPAVTSVVADPELEPRPGRSPSRVSRRPPRGGPHSSPRRGGVRRRAARTATADRQ
jgi:hypothetical protein